MMLRSVRVVCSEFRNRRFISQQLGGKWSPRVDQILRSIDVQKYDAIKNRVEYEIGDPSAPVSNIGERSLSELMKKTLLSLSSSPQDSVDLLNIVAARQRIQASREGSRTIAQMYSEFWNQAVFEVMRAWHTQNQFKQRSNEMDTTLFQLYNVLASVNFELTASHSYILREVWFNLISLPKMCEKFRTNNSVENASHIIQQILFSANAVSNLVGLGHFCIQEKDVVSVQQNLLSDSRPIATFINHFMDTTSISLNDFAEVFHMLSCFGIFSPECLTTSILLYKRRSFELTPKGSMHLMKSASMLLSQQVQLLKSLEPHWVIREEVAKTLQTQIENLRELKQSMDEGHQFYPDPNQSNHVRYYDQSFFNEFDDQSDSSNVVLGMGDAMTESIQNSVDLNKRMADVTALYKDTKDSSMDMIRRTVQIESVFLIKSICASLCDDKIQYFDSDELQSLLEILASIQYIPGSLLTKLVADILPSRLVQFKPHQLTSIVAALARLNVRNAQFLQLVCHEVMSHTSIWTVELLVQLALALSEIDFGSSELLSEISNRRDELLRSSQLKTEDLRRLEEVFQTLEVEFPELKSHLSK